jgi:membrane protein implicated in regulation of membrane protease activity
MLAMWIWFGAAIVLLIIELCTVDLVAVWFGLSALVMGVITGIAPKLGWGWQIGIFAVLSAGLLMATRPLVKKFLAKKKNSETNLELVIGHKALVVEEINDFEQGAVRINGLIWTARSEDGSVIEKDMMVTVKEIRGNKVIVSKE